MYLVDLFLCVKSMRTETAHYLFRFIINQTLLFIIVDCQHLIFFRSRYKCFSYRNPQFAADVQEQMVSIKTYILDTFVFSFLFMWLVCCCQLRQEINVHTNFTPIDLQVLHFERSSALHSFLIIGPLHK